MKTITAKFSAPFLNLDMFVTTGIRLASKKILYKNKLTVIWICENESNALESCMDCIDMNQLENWGVNLLSITEK